MYVGVRNWVAGLSNSSSSFPEESLEKNQRLLHVLRMNKGIEAFGEK